MARLRSIQSIARSLANLLQEGAIERPGTPFQLLRAVSLHSSAVGAYSAPGAAAAVAPATLPSQSWELEEPSTSTSDLTPRQIVEMLDRHIVGQNAAKKAVANALRNRWRRRQVPSPLREEIVPKNILMLGPTGCGKTEIARRLAKLADAPFVKVEATKFTEVGFHGRDVDQIIRDLVENAIIMVRQRMRREQAAAIELAVEDKLVAAMVGEHASKETVTSFRRLYRDKELEDREVEVDVPPSPQRMPFGGDSSAIPEMVIRVDRLFRGAAGGKSDSKRKMKVSEARPLVEEAEAERFINNEAVTREAIVACEQDGIVFIDEIDKIVTSSEYRYGADASSEGVQRDLLPIIEGSTVSTKHGNINTDYILFICSGAFHSAKPSDMLAELQGRLPVRVELSGLKSEDFYRILTEPESNMIKQQQALLATEGVALSFTDAAVKEISIVAEEVNTTVDNIGARRLHTILERIIEDISFDAPERTKEGGKSAGVVIDKEDVRGKLNDLLKTKDLKSQPTTTSTAASPPTATPNNALLEKHVIYQGRGIRLFRVLVRLKVFQLSGVAALAVPITTFLSNGEVGPYQTVIAAALVTGSAAASTALWYFSRRYVGELSLLIPQKQQGDNKNDDKNNDKIDISAATEAEAAVSGTTAPTQTGISSSILKEPRVRFSVLDFWGNRENVDVDMSDIVPPLEGLQPAVATLMAAEPALPVHVTGDRKFILSLRYGRVVDGVALRALLEGRREDLAGIVEERQGPPLP